jgi:hypothetical protein
MRKLATRFYLRGFTVLTAVVAFAALTQSAFADCCGSW